MAHTASAHAYKHQSPLWRSPALHAAQHRMHAMAPTNSLLGFLRGGNSGGGIGSKTLLLNELRNPKPDIARIDAAVDELLDAKVPFKAADLGGGPFNAVYTRGPVLGWTAFTGNATGSRVIKQTDNQAWQDFDPSSNGLVNYGELLGSQVFVKVSGSYQATDDSQQRCPKTVCASIGGGCLRAWGLRIPLPIRGQGLVDVAFLDCDMRVFRSTNGSVSVQVKQDKLPQLLGWPSS